MDTSRSASTSVDFPALFRPTTIVSGLKSSVWSSKHRKLRSRRVVSMQLLPSGEE